MPPGARVESRAGRETGKCRPGGGGCAWDGRSLEGQQKKGMVPYMVRFRMGHLDRRLRPSAQFILGTAWHPLPIARRTLAGACRPLLLEPRVSSLFLFHPAAALPPPSTRSCLLPPPLPVPDPTLPPPAPTTPHTATTTPSPSPPAAPPQLALSLAGRTALRRPFHFS